MSGPWVHNKDVSAWPKIWTSGGKVPDFPKGEVHHYFNVVSFTGQDKFPYIRETTRYLTLRSTPIARATSSAGYPCYR